MFSTKNKTLKEQIFSQISDFDIFQHYFPFEPRKMYNSPFRKDDKPSFNIYLSSEGTWAFNDYGSKGGNCFSFVMALFNLTYEEACRKILKECCQGEPLREGQTTASSNIIYENKPYDIKFLSRPFNKDEIAYWNQYGISEEECKENEIWVARKLWINDKLSYIPKNHLCFIYRFTKDGEMFRKKLYQPYSEKYKWRTNIKTSFLEGISSLPKQSNIVLGTKSRKDRIVLSKVYKEIFNLQNEHPTSIPKEVDKFLDENYDAKFLWLDADSVGKNTNIELNKRGYLWVNCPEQYQAKDPSDLIAKLGIKEGYTILENELKKKNIII